MATETDIRPGDVLVDYNDRRYTIRDAAFLARLALRNVQNWQARGLFAAGAKHHATGRWLFSLWDVLQLAVMSDLCREGVDLGPRKASVIAEFAVAEAKQNLAQPDEGFRRNLNVLVAWDENGKMLLTTANIKHPGNYYPPVGTDDYSPLRRPIISIPVTSMAIDIGIRTEALAAHNARAEAPTHD